MGGGGAIKGAVSSYMLLPQDSQNTESSSTRLLHERQRTRICGSITVGCDERVVSSPRRGAVELTSGDTSGTVAGGAELSDTSGTVGRDANRSSGFDKSVGPAGGHLGWHLTQNFHPGCAVSPQAGQRKETASPSPPPQDSQNARLSGKLRLHRGQSFIVAPGIGRADDMIAAARPIAILCGFAKDSSQQVVWTV